jgi:hypothetical protein
MKGPVPLGTGPFRLRLDRADQRCDRAGCRPAGLPYDYDYDYDYDNWPS